MTVAPKWHLLAHNNKCVPTDVRLIWFGITHWNTTGFNMVVVFNWISATNDTPGDIQYSGGLITKQSPSKHAKNNKNTRHYFNCLPL